MAKNKRVGLTKRERKAAGLQVANPERVAAELERRRSSAARPHTNSKPRRAAKAAAIKEGW